MTVHYCRLANSYPAISDSEMWGEVQDSAWYVHFHVHQDAAGQRCVRYLGGEVKKVGWDVSIKLRGEAGIVKWVCRLGIHKHLDDSHSHGPACDH